MEDLFKFVIVGGVFVLIVGMLYGISTCWTDPPKEENDPDDYA